MTALQFIREHWLEILIGLSLLPAVLRAVLKPEPASTLDRWLSRYEALVIDVRKILKSFGLALPGANVEPIPGPPQPYIPPALQRHEDIPSEAVTADLTAELDTVSTIRPPAPEPPRGAQ